MSLEKKIEIDKIEIVQKWNIQVRQKTSVLENGKEISSSFHRYVLTPDSDMINEPENVKNISNAVWTDNIKAEYLKFKNGVVK